MSFTFSKRYFSKYIEKNNMNIFVDSSGTSREHFGENPFYNSIKVAKDNNIDISLYKAKQFLKTDIQKFDLIVALDNSNYNNLLRMGCENLVKLGNFGFNGKDVPDPYYFNGFEGFVEVFNMIEKCVNELLLNFEKNN